MAKKHLNDDDRSLWEKVTESVTPMMRPRFLQRPSSSAVSPQVLNTPPKTLGPKTLGPKNLAPKTSTPKPPAVMPSSKVSGKILPANLDEKGYGGISRSGARSIKTGQAGYTSRIDLHGCGRDEAHQRLKAFIAASVNNGHRHVLIITGKGMGGKGVIRSHLPIWLDEPPLSSHVIAYCQAQPKDGGAGAWYVNLRRRS